MNSCIEVKICAYLCGNSVSKYSISFVTFLLETEFDTLDSNQECLISVELTLFTAIRKQISPIYCITYFTLKNGKLTKIEEISNCYFIAIKFM